MTAENVSQVFRRSLRLPGSDNHQIVFGVLVHHAQENAVAFEHVLQALRNESAPKVVPFAEGQLRVAGHGPTLNDAMHDLLERTRSVSPTRSDRNASGPVLLFAGQGSQAPSMTRELYAWHSGFRASIDECALGMIGKLPLPLQELLYAADADDERIHQTQIAQPALFAMEYALAKLWFSAGVQPSALIGHSIGEVAAATIAGVIDLDAAVELVLHRAQLMQALPPGGGMVSVLASCDVVEAEIEAAGVAVEIAAVNTAQNVVVAGELGILTSFVERLKSQGVGCQPLVVSHAFHSARMEPMLQPFAQRIEHMQFQRPRLPLVSTVSAEPVHDDAMNAAYWVRQVRSRVNFAGSLTYVDGQGADTYLEIGPASNLIGLAKRHLGRRGRNWIPSLKKDQEDVQSILDSACSLYALGQPIVWDALVGTPAVASESSSGAKHVEGTLHEYR